MDITYKRSLYYTYIKVPSYRSCFKVYVKFYRKPKIALNGTDPAHVVRIHTHTHTYIIYCVLNHTVLLNFVDSIDAYENGCDVNVYVKAQYVTIVRLFDVDVYILRNFQRSMIYFAEVLWTRLAAFSCNGMPGPYDRDFDAIFPMLLFWHGICMHASMNIYTHSKQ